MKTYSPSFILIVYLIIYLILRYQGIRIDIKNYITSIYRGYKMMVAGMLYIMMRNQNLISLLTNFLSTLYIFYQLYTMYSSIETSMSHFGKCRDFKKKFGRIREFITYAQQIYTKDKNIINNFDHVQHDKIIQSIQFLDQHISQKSMSSMGKLLLIKKECSELMDHFDTLKDYIGTVDAFINISKLVTCGGFIFPEYVFNSNFPFIESKGLWSLYIDTRIEQVPNDCEIGFNNPNTMILTGPNTSGKSTYIRNIMLTILFSQTLAISPCKSLRFTPFVNLFTYLDIPNISRNRESLFEAEVHRCLDFCKTLESIQPNHFSFTIMDELFTGTNPPEGISGSFSVCEYLGHFNNSLMIVTTHFNKLTELQDIYKDKFINKKFYVVKYPDGTFYRPYKIADGVSNQNIAIELLRNKGYNSSIIDRAISILNSIDN